MSASFMLALALGWLSQAQRAMVVGQGLGNFILSTLTNLVVLSFPPMASDHMTTFMPQALLGSC